MKKIVNAFTIDFEDWYQGIEIEQNQWDKFQDRIKDNAYRLLSILDETQTKATFFVLGYVAERFPELVKLISEKGHEIGTHGYSHQFIYKQTKKEFENELKHSLEIIESITSQKIVSHRAAFFSITKESLWALDILSDYGIKYDSSIFPVINYRYGIPEAKRFPHRIKTSSGKEIVEFPISTIRFFGQNLPISGGAYFRILPYQFISAGIRNINKKGYPVIFYLHPWEIDPQHPRIKLPLRISITHYWNLNAVAKKIHLLLKTFRFASMKEALNGKYSE